MTVDEPSVRTRIGFQVFYTMKGFENPTIARLNFVPLSWLAGVPVEVGFAQSVGGNVLMSRELMWFVNYEKKMFEWSLLY